MSLTEEILCKYPNDVFIETGSYDGWGIQLALESGFKEIYSIEILSYRVKILTERFKNKPVTIICGDSAVILPKLINFLPNIRATIWLDAHESTELITKGNKYPLKYELNCLVGTPHTILIDDIRLISLWGLTINGILEMFPEKKMFFENDMYGNENDIMVLK